ncbi:unnamed protein product [Pieris brassicae]|uniref:Uncharacterized protein n=1 Tax=Pieris brassicae TaxID=7116 RepID=A0A9P0XBX8_PIEBR|nr:unnamed protein product [Pieris brassicae]
MAAELGVPPKNLMQWTETDAPLQAVGDRFGNLGVGPQEDMVPSRRAGVNVLKPCAIKDYNCCTGDVDLKDQKLAVSDVPKTRIQMVSQGV